MPEKEKSMAQIIGEVNLNYRWGESESMVYLFEAFIFWSNLLGYVALLNEDREGPPNNFPTEIDIERDRDIRDRENLLWRENMEYKNLYLQE